MRLEQRVRLIIGLEADDDSPAWRLAALLLALFDGLLRGLDRLAAAVVAVEVWCQRQSICWQVTWIVFLAVAYEIGSQSKQPQRA